MTKSERDEKMLLYGHSLKALKVYTVLLLLLIFRQLVNYLFIAVGGVWPSAIVVVKDVVLVGLAVAAAVMTWGLDAKAQTINIVFLIYLPVTGGAQLICSLVQNNLEMSALRGAGQNTGDAVANYIVGSATNYLAAGMGLVMLFSILFYLVLLGICIGYIIFFVRHTPLFCKSLARLRKEME